MLMETALKGHKNTLQKTTGVKKTQTLLKTTYTVNPGKY